MNIYDWTDYSSYCLEHDIRYIGDECPVEALEAENERYKQALENIARMRSWAGQWRLDEFTSTSYQRLIEAYDLADAALKEAEDG